MPDPILVCTLHDPLGVVLDLATDDILGGVRATFARVAVVCSAETDSRAELILTRHGFIASRLSAHRLELYQAALRAGVQSADYLMYVDFDRILHWQRTYPSELARVARLVTDGPFTVFGRTARAFASHPACQRLTEGAASEIFRHLYPVPPETDIFASCWGLSAPAAHMLLDAPMPSGSAFYALWPAYLVLRGMRFRYVAVDGLEWETPDVFASEIAASGYEDWLRRFETADQWRSRVEMSAEWVSELVRLAPAR